MLDSSERDSKPKYSVRGRFEVVIECHFGAKDESIAYTPGFSLLAIYFKLI